VTGVSTQTLSTAGNLVATAAGYDASGASTVYAGTLNVTDTASANLNLKADSAVVNVKSTTSGATAATFVGSDLQTSLTVNLTNSANASSNPSGDNLSTATIDLATSNASLKSIVLTGAGSVVIDASAGGSLTSVNASQLGGTIANGTTKGAITGGLEYFANATNAETITLGSGHDIVHVASTYGAMDTIVGFDAAREGTTAVSTSDVLTISAAQTGGSALTLNGTAALVAGTSHVAGISMLTLATTDSTLDLAFVHAAAAATAGNVVEFQFGGNTYLFADTNHNGTLDNADFALKLVGTVDVTGQFGVAPTV
jgi:hypothetical protein